MSATPCCGSPEHPNALRRVTSTSCEPPEAWEVLSQHFDASSVRRCHPHVHVTQERVEPHSCTSFTTRELACTPQELPVFAPSQTWCTPLCGFLEDPAGPHTRRTWLLVMGRGRPQPLQQQNPGRCGGMTYSGAVGAWANTTPALRPEWDRRCARLAAVWPDSMVIFLKCLSEAEEAQYCQPCCHLTWFLRCTLGKPPTPAEFWPTWSLNESLTIQLVCGTCQLEETTLFRKNIVNYGKLNHVGGTLGLSTRMLERSIIEWERLNHRLSTQHNFKFEPRQLFAILIRGLPEDLRLTMNRDGVVEFLALRGRVIEYCRNKRLSDPIHSNEVNSDMMCPVRKGTTKGVPKGRYVDGKSGISCEQKVRGKQGKGKGTKEHDYASMFYYFLDGHSRSNLHVSLPIQDFIDWYEEADNHENRPREKHRIEHRRV